MLVAAGDADEEVTHEVRLEIHVRGDVVTRVRSRIGGTEAGEHLRANGCFARAGRTVGIEDRDTAVTIRIGLSSLDAVTVSAILGADRRAERRRERTLDLAEEIEVRRG